MIRIVLDTNVLVSAILIPQSKPAKILTLAREGRIRLIFSVNTLKELYQVLHYSRLLALIKKKGISLNLIDDFLKNIAQSAIITAGKIKVKVIIEDPADNMFLACAVEGQVDFIVSGDQHLKNLKIFQGITIVDPAKFLKTISDIS